MYIMTWPLISMGKTGGALPDRVWGPSVITNTTTVKNEYLSIKNLSHNILNTIIKLIN